VNSLEIRAQTAEVVTSFSGIYGTFIASRALTLTTSEAAINVKAILVREKGSSPPVSLALKTEIAVIQATVTVNSTQQALSNDTSNPDFTIAAESSKAPVSLAVDYAPGSAPGTIDLIAKSLYAPVVVSLGSKYEGSFSLNSDVGVEVHRGQNVVDPSGMNRPRYFSENDDESQGYIYWSGDQKNPLTQGSVNLTTQHAKVLLYLDSQCNQASCLLSQGSNN